MPHSSGGGHGGGGYHSGGHGGGSCNYASSIYKPGLSRYVYYTDNTQRFFYSGVSPSEFSKSEIFSSVLMVYIFIAILLFPIVESLLPKVKLSQDYDTQIIIEDGIDIFTDSEEKDIEKVFKDIQDKTGITMSLITLNNNEWRGKCANLENYAYNLYVWNFEDEKHWLIAYSTDSANNWYFEGMQGDDTDSILTESLTTKFNKILYDNLEQYGNKNISHCFLEAFNYISENAMKIRFPDISGNLFTLFIIALLIYSQKDSIETLKNFDKIKDAKKCPTEQGELDIDTCTHCGNTFITGLYNECPHCGKKLNDY